MTQAQMEQWAGRHRERGMKKDMNEWGGLQSHPWPAGSYKEASGAQPKGVNCNL